MADDPPVMFCNRVIAIRLAWYLCTSTVLEEKGDSVFRTDLLLVADAGDFQVRCHCLAPSSGSLVKTDML